MYVNDSASRLKAVTMPYHQAAFYTEGPALFIFISALDEGLKTQLSSLQTVQRQEEKLTP